MVDTAHNVLVLRNRTKGIPYLGVKRDRSTNHGFVALKGKPAGEARKIAEAGDVEAVARCLERLNHADTGFFTVGCEKAFNVDGDVHWAKGYVEFALNSIELASDAQQYFKLFFEFNHRLFAKNFNLPVQYGWELEGAMFQTTDTSGFTATVWVTTDVCPMEGEARELWSRALDELTDFLCELGPLDPAYARIY